MYCNGLKQEGRASKVEIQMENIEGKKKKIMNACGLGKKKIIEIILYLVHSKKFVTHLVYVIG